MANTTYTLEYNGEVIANIPGAGYATPEFSGRVEPVNQEVFDQVVKVQEFEVWSDEGLPDDISDEDYYKEMEQYGVQRKYYDMWNSKGWVVRGSDGTVSPDILSVDLDGISWRPDPNQPAQKSGGFLSFFKKK